MRKSKDFILSEEEKDALYSEYQTNENKFIKTRCYSVYLRSIGKDISEIANIIGMSDGAIKSWIYGYEKQGISFLMKEKGRLLLNKRNIQNLDSGGILDSFSNVQITNSSSEPFKCIVCGKEYPNHTRKYFVQHIVAGKYLITNVCKECKKNKNYNREYSSDMTKLLCHKCLQYKPISEFHKDTTQFINTPKGSRYRVQYRGGRKSYCKDCYRIVERERYENRSDESKLYKYLQFRWLGARDRAKKHNMEFSITKDDLMNLYKKQNGLCAISGMKMTYEMYNGRTNTNISIDRKDPFIGYTIDNIQLVCMVINQMKNDLSLNELLCLCNKIIEYNNQQL